MNEGKRAIELDGNLWFTKAETRFLGADRIALLQSIDELGSINKAAKAQGISYKTAWQLVNTINNLADKPLVERTAGGKDGGGTVLTPSGRTMLEQYTVIEEEHRKFLENLEERLADSGKLYKFLNRVSMNISARNILSGTITHITREAVNAEVTLSLKGEIPLTAIVTNSAIDKLNLEVGSKAIAIIKSSYVIVGKDIDVQKVSTRNVLKGTIAKIIEGPVNSEVDIAVGDGNIITSIITHESCRNLGLKEGDPACAMFKASSVIIGIN